MKYGSVCSGIEAASAAWEPLGWKPVFFSEIDPFPRAVLAHHYPNVPCHGDFTTINRDSYAVIDVLVGGTPCFTGDTLILTDRGVVPISEVAVGDVVMTHLGNWKKVLAIGSKVSETILAKGQGSSGIRTTSEHPFWAMSKESIWHNDIRCAKMEFVGDPKWVEASKMQGKFWAIPATGEKLHGPIPFLSGNESALPECNKHLMFLAGAYLGNGWTRISERRGVAIFGMGKRDHSKLEEAIFGCGLSFSKSLERTTYKYHVSSRSVARWLADQFGSGAAGKSIPSWAIYGLDKEMREALLAGYLYTDGCENKVAGRKNGWKITTISRKLALTAKLLGASLGYSISVKYMKTAATTVIEGRTVNQSDYWDVFMYDNSRSAGRSHGMLWQKCKSVTPTNEIETVYNLEVEGDNSYVADGIVVHNCQDFSLAGLRAGLDGGRGNLSLEFGRLLGRLRPQWFCWENVPGVFSSNNGEDFAGILGMFTGRSVSVPADGWRNSGVLQGIGSAYSVAWRVLDAQYLGVPQRRRRVFVVGCLGADWRRAFSVLFESHSMSGDSPPRRKKRKESTTCFETSPSSYHSSEVSPCLDTRTKNGPVQNQTGIAIVGHSVYSEDSNPSLTSSGGDCGGGSESLIVTKEQSLFQMEAFGQYEDDGTASTMKMRDYKDATDLVVVKTSDTGSNGSNFNEDGVTYTLDTINGQAVVQPIAFSQNQRDEIRDLNDVAGSLMAEPGMKQQTFLAYGIDEECNAKEELFGSLLRGGEGGTRQTVVQIPESEVAKTLKARHDGSPDGEKGYDMVSVHFEDPTPINTQLGLRGENTSNSNREGLGIGNPGDPSFTLQAHHGHAVAHAFVRRLTPKECSRLQGFPDDFSKIPWKNKPAGECPDGPQYKCYGNSMAVPVMSWIGKRIQMVHEMIMKAQ